MTNSNHTVEETVIIEPCPFCGAARPLPPSTPTDPIAIIDRMIETYRSSGIDECLDWIEPLRLVRTDLAKMVGKE